jgi:site-specific DNA-cytosine methylase
LISSAVVEGSEGLRQAGFDVVLGIDHDPWAIKTYNKYHHDRGRIKKVEDIDRSFNLATELLLCVNNFGIRDYITSIVTFLSM